MGQGCHLKTYHYTDPAYRVSVEYPGEVSLLTDPEMLGHAVGEVEQESLLFALQTPNQATITCAVHTLPENLDTAGLTYFQATTARELKEMGAVIVEPINEVVIDGRNFEWVGFTLPGEPPVRARIYQHYNARTHRVLVVSPSAPVDSWAKELTLLEQLVHSIRMDWGQPGNVVVRSPMGDTAEVLSHPFQSLEWSPIEVALARSTLEARPLLVLMLEGGLDDLSRPSVKEGLLSEPAVIRALGKHFVCSWASPSTIEELGCTGTESEQHAARQMLENYQDQSEIVILSPNGELVARQGIGKWSGQPTEEHLRQLTSFLRDGARAAVGTEGM